MNKLKELYRIIFTPILIFYNQSNYNYFCIYNRERYDLNDEQSSRYARGLLLNFELKAICEKRKRCLPTESDLIALKDFTKKTDVNKY